MAEQTKKIPFRNPFLIDERTGTQGTGKKKKKGEDLNTEIVDISVKDKSGKKITETIKHNIPRTGAFKEYISMEEIAAKIAEQLIKDKAYKAGNVRTTDYDKIIGGGMTFFLTPEIGLRRTGLLSLCPAIVTGIKLYGAMADDVDEAKDGAENKESKKEELLNAINDGIEAMFRIIFRLEDKKDWRGVAGLKPVFDASPYEMGAFYEGLDERGLEGRSFIDSITWAVPVFLRILNFKDGNSEKYVFEEYRDKARELAKWCLDYVNNALLTDKSEENNDTDENRKDKKNIKPVGWSFTRLKNPTEESKSLYFTYAASTLYLSFHEEFGDAIRGLIVFDKAKENKEIELGERYWTDLKAVEKEINKLKKNEEHDAEKLKEFETALKLLQKAERNRTLKEYLYFNDDKPAGYHGKDYQKEFCDIVNAIDEKDERKKRNAEAAVGSLSRLKWCLEKIAESLWENAKKDDKLENNFVYDDFNLTVATPDAILSGGQTNALFAGLLVIGIIINSAYDLVVLRNDNDDDSQKKYDDMQETMLLHVQRTQRFYDKLEEEGRGYGVESLILRFSMIITDPDDVDDVGQLTDRELADKLRKNSIRVSSLTPMLLKTNNLISQYVVQYPQKQMGESLVRIAKRRFYDRKKAVDNENDGYFWYWESDNYHATSNYYYVSAIFDFYTYYETYEKAYVERYENVRETLVRDLDFADDVQKHYQKIEDQKKELNAELKDKTNEIEKARKDYEALELKSKLGNDIVNNINQIVVKYIQSPTFIRTFIGEIRKQLAEELVEKYRTQNLYENKESLERLKNPTVFKDVDKNDKVFSLLQALLVDVILSSAIEAERNELDGVVDLGQTGLKGKQSAEFVLEGSDMLLNDELVNDLFSGMFARINWRKKDGGKTK
jgi:hypothetical protein